MGRFFFFVSRQRAVFENCARRRTIISSLINAKKLKSGFKRFDVNAGLLYNDATIILHN